MERLPYRFGAPVEPPWFCDRERERDMLVSGMAAGIHVVVLSPRRYGKTSLLRRAARRLEAEGGCCAYANLLLATDETELAAVILQAAVRSVLGRTRRARQSLETILRQLPLTSRVSVSSDGSVSLSLDAAAAGSSWLEVVRDALALLRRASGKRPAALALDEFQVVASIGGRDAGGAFKAIADAAEGLSVVFCGSQPSVMEGLSGTSLDGMGERIVLGVVPEGPMVAYLSRRAKAAGKSLELETGRLVYALADAIPNHVQQLALAAFEAAGSAGSIGNADVDHGFDTVVERAASSYAQQFAELGAAPSQQRILKALARQPTVSVYAKAFLDAAGVANANAVTTALRALDARELVVRRGGAWDVADPFLRRWLVRG